MALTGAPGNDVAINGALSLNLGSGGNSIRFDTMSIAGGMTHTSSADAFTEVIKLTRVRANRFISLNGTGENASLGVDVIDCVVGSFFSVSSGGGDDKLNLDRTRVLGLGLQPQQQTFGVNLKGGTNEVKIGTAGADAGNVVNGSLFYFGAGKETFTLVNYTINSFVTFNAEAGNTGVTASITSTKISSFLSFAAVGSSDDRITVDNLSIGQNFALNLGGGTNTSAITNNQYLGSYSEIDTGIDQVTFNGNSGFGDVTFTAARLVILPGQFVKNQIAGNARFTATVTGANDSVFLGAAPGATPSVSNAVSVGKAVTIDVGSCVTGGDNVYLNNVTMKTDLTISAVVAVATGFFVTNTTIGGNLAVAAGSSTANTSVFLGTNSSSGSGPLRIIGNLNITTGAGNDPISLTDIRVGGTTTITTNGGGDILDIESGGSTLDGPSEFIGAFTLSTGAAADTIRLGLNASNVARFFGAVSLDGGAVTDTLTETSVNYYGGSPTRTDIP